MSVYDNQVHKCERCGELYTTKDVNGDKVFKYVIANNSKKASSCIDASSVTISLGNNDELGLCPDCLRSLEEWMKGPSVPPEDLRETPLAKALREFAETVKGIKTGL